MFIYFSWVPSLVQQPAWAPGPWASSPAVPRAPHRPHLWRPSLSEAPYEESQPEPGGPSAASAHWHLPYEHRCVLGKHCGLPIGHGVMDLLGSQIVVPKWKFVCLCVHARVYASIISIFVDDSEYNSSLATYLYYEWWKYKGNCKVTITSRKTKKQTRKKNIIDVFCALGSLFNEYKCSTKAVSSPVMKYRSLLW